MVSRVDHREFLVRWEDVVDIPLAFLVYHLGMAEPMEDREMPGVAADNPVEDSLTACLKVVSCPLQGSYHPCCNRWSALK